MATLNWPGFGITSISPTFDQPSQSNSSDWSGTRTVVSNPWHGKWSFKVSLATVQGDGAFQAARAFFTSLKGQINTFHLPAVEAPQNANTGVTLSANAAQGATSIALTGLTTALVAGNMVTIAGQLLSLTSVGSLSGSAQTVSFMPSLRAAATSGASVQTAKPYALVYLSDSSFTWDIGQWRRYGLMFNASEAVGETDDADPALDVWTGGVGAGGGGSMFSFPQLPSFISRTLLAAVPSPPDKQVAYLTEAGREGEFVFSTANLSTFVTADTAQAIYVAPAATTSGASGAWVRKSDAPPSVRQAGTKADDSTDDAPAFMAMIADQKASAVTGYQYGNASFRVDVPKGAPAYRLASTIDVDIAARFEAQGTGYGPGIWASLLHPDVGVTAIRTQTSTTTGESGTYAGSLFTGNGAMFVGFGVVGRYNGTTNLEVATGGHAFHLRATAILRNGGASDMQGDGIHIHAGVATAGFIGNANGWEVTRFLIQNCTNGLSTKYSDSNAGMATLVSVSGCREWAFKNESGASNVYLACSSQSCGVYGDGTAAKPASACHQSGHHYYVRVGQEAWCSVNAPTGTTSSNTGWGWMETGAAVNPGYVTWFNGMVCRAGGAGRFATGALVLGFYYESNQPPVQNGADALMMGGTWGGLGRPVGGAYINAGNNQLLANDLLIERGSLTIADDQGGAILLGRTSPGNPAVVRPSSGATYLALEAPAGGQNVNIYDSDLVRFLEYSGGGYSVATTAFAPLVDNHNSLGASGKRWTELWAASATIQTSDRAHKSHVRKLSGRPFDALLDAVGAVPLLAFKFKDAVKAKGKHARDHYGIIAQDLHDELVKRGLDPFIGGVLGRDPVLEEVEEEVEVEREAMRIEFQYEDRNEVVEGKVIRRKVLVEKPEPDFDYLPVHDEGGNPVIIPARPPHKRMALVDGEIKEVEVPGSPARPMTHPVRRIERVKEKQTVSKPKLGEDGEPEMIWSVRYSEFFALRQAWLERELRPHA